MGVGATLLGGYPSTRSIVGSAIWVFLSALCVSDSVSLMSKLSPLWLLKYWLLHITGVWENR